MFEYNFEIQAVGSASARKDEAVSRLTQALSVLDLQGHEVLARRLVDRFGSFTETVWASAHALEAAGVPEKVRNYLAILKESAIAMDEEVLPKRLLLEDVDALGAYLRKQFGGCGASWAKALYLDNGNRLLGQEVLCRGSAVRIGIYRREIMKTALVRFNATRIVIGFSHPDGALALPYDSVWQLQVMAEDFKLLDVQLIDVLVVHREGYRSLWREGVFPRFREDGFRVDVA